MKPPLFAYYRPNSVAEAVARLAREEGAVPLAGGQSLIPMLNMRLARPTTVVDLGGIADLQGIDVSPDSIRLGARVTHAALEKHGWPHGYEAIPEGVRQIGYGAIRNRGTVGGSLAHADPAAELPALMLAFGASIQLASPRGERSMVADDFFLGYYETARASDEIITSVRIPVRDDLRSGFSELSRRRGDFAIALAVAVRWKEAGRTEARAVVGGLDVRPRRIPEVEEALVTGSELAITADLLARHVHPANDVHASAEYRLEVGAEMLRRAVWSMENREDS